MGVTTLVAAAVFGGGWAAASAVQSPAQREAAASAPPKQPVTAAVTRGDLADTITSEATVRRAARERLALTAAEAPAVVTGTPVPAGQEVVAGRSLLEVNGRPIVAMPGAFRFYRDLESGRSGPDVRQLQQGLTAAGFAVPADGVFGTGTERAARDLYRAIGYPAHEVADPAPAKADAGASDAESSPPTTHIVIPRAELVVMATDRAHLVTGPGVGASVDDETEIVVERGELIAVAEVPSTVGVRVRAGMTGTLTAAGKDAPVKVTRVDDAAKEGESTIELAPTAAGATISSAAGRAFLRLDIEVVRRNSLLVPSTAVVTGGTAGDHVRKRLADGGFVRVPVDEAGQLGGQSAVVPTTRGMLQTGDLVRVD